jgi:hypothetical protein
MFVFCSIVIILYAVFFLEAMDKYKKKALRKSFQQRLNSLTGQRGEKRKYKLKKTASQNE